MARSSKTARVRVPTREKLYTKAETEDLTNNDLLALESGIFYLPIAVLETCLGVTEYNKRREVTTVFNLLRAADNIEDGRINKREKPSLIDLYLNSIIVPIARRDTGEDITDILEGDSLKILTENLKRGSREDQDQITFAEHFGRGAVLRELNSFDRETKGEIEYTMIGIGQGMREFLSRG